MADQTLPDKPETLVDELYKAWSPIYVITALLAGTESLLEKTNAPDTDGLIWSARELVKHTQGVVDGMMSALDDVSSRAKSAH